MAFKRTSKQEQELAEIYQSISDIHQHINDFKSKLQLTNAHILANEGMSEQLHQALHGKLDLILNQTTKTNGTVAEVVRELAKAREKIHELEIADINHINKCPQTEKIESIENILLEYKFFQKNPWFMYIGIAAVSIGIFIGIYEVFLK